MRSSLIIIALVVLLVVVGNPFQSEEEPARVTYAGPTPVGLKFTVAAGVLSGFFGEENIKLVQTEAPINPGSSGAPLLDRAGRGVGANTLVTTQAPGVDFSISISTAVQGFDLAAS